MKLKTNFHGIWFRDTAPAISDWENRESGKLTICDDLIKFKSRNFDIEITRIDNISLGLKGTDLTNAWIEINYRADDKKESIYLCDGKFLGYSGVFGGTRRIAKMISKKFDINLIIDPTYIKVQLSLLSLLLYTFLIMFFKGYIKF